MKKAALVITDDLGNGTDYIYITTTKDAVKGQINLRGNEVAVAASLTLESADSGIGFRAAEDISATINANGGNTPTITAGLYLGPNVTINVAAGDTLFNVATNISNAF